MRPMSRYVAGVVVEHGSSYILLSLVGRAVATSVNEDARMAVFEMSSRAAYGFVHERCRSRRFSSGDVA
jgi:hypothetical protein